MKYPNGYGTVYRLKGNRRRPWVAAITRGWANPESYEGRNRYIIGYYEESKDARKALDEYKDNPMPKSKITLGELYKEWAEMKYTDSLSHKTIKSYKGGWTHLKKYEGVKFTELKTSHFQKVIKECQDNGLGKSALEKIKIVANMLCEYAMQNDIVNKNYAGFIKIPKMDKLEKQGFNDLEIQKLEKAVDDVLWVDTILILIYTGFRINELLGVTRFNIDMGKQLITGGIKTEAGRNRIVPIHPKILKHIAAWYNRNGEYLICDKDGKALRDRDYREDCYYPALEKVFDIKWKDEKSHKARIDVSGRQWNPHICRHTFATLMAKAGVDTIDIQKLIGHTDYALTANVYTHTDIDKLRNAINRM